ncbi:hypothetical protein [Lysinibacillus sp. 54212]|uniref:hypothetical protein n=1 Tax=Lysinibacillus sp. 54212 TaxID=3119829 RepID=UPI002FC6D103
MKISLEDWENNFIRLCAKPFFTIQDRQIFARLMDMELDEKRVLSLLEKHGLTLLAQEKINSIECCSTYNSGLPQSLSSTIKEQKNLLLHKGLDELAARCAALYKNKEIKLIHYHLLCKALLEYQYPLQQIAEPHRHLVLQTIYLFELEEELMDFSVTSDEFDPNKDSLYEIIGFE